MIPTHKQRQSGFSVVELMIAMLLSMTLAAAIVTVFVNNNHSFNQDENVGRMQDGQDKIYFLEGAGNYMSEIQQARRGETRQRPRARTKRGGLGMSQETEAERVFEMRPIGFVRSPHRQTTDITKGPGAKHRAEGALEVRPELEDGLEEIEQDVGNVGNGIPGCFGSEDRQLELHVAESAARDDLFSHPIHPYTQALMSAIPIPDPEIEQARAHKIIKGEIPSPINPPPGCVFHPRCPIAVDACKQHVPEFREVKPGHWVACSEV